MSIKSNRYPTSLMILCVLIGVNQIVAADLPATVGSGQDIRNSNTLEQSPRGESRRGRRIEGVYKDRIVPHWCIQRTPDGQENTCFWYRNDLTGDTKEYILINADQGTRQAAFDHKKLAASLSEAAGTDYTADKLPFDSIEFLDDTIVIQFVVDQTTWTCDLSSYTCSKTDSTDSELSNDQNEQDSRTGRRPRGRDRGRNRSVESPNGEWTAVIKDNNVFLQSEDEEEIQLSEDGEEGNAYGVLSWSPDSQILVAFRIEPGDNKEVYLIESSPEEGGRAKFNTRSYDLPGDKLAMYELNIFNVAERKEIKPQVDRFEHGWERPDLHWNREGNRFSYKQVDRGHQRLRVIEVDARTGQIRNLVDEKSDTYIWTVHTENLRLDLVNWLEQSEEIIYVSEQDGWRHLYLVDSEQDKMNQITKGEWVVRGIGLIDEDARQIWFSAGGRNKDQDPYFIHYYRVNFDGTGLVALTEGKGSHSIQYSPDRKYIIDTYSRVDMAPIHELRRTSDGELICELEKADITELIAEGWKPPEVFVSKGRDGKTDIWGIICRPGDFDPDKKYPVIEYIYAGPQGSFVPKSFRPSTRFESLADLGFIVVQMDGMGTANRSKAFHDVCWHNLKDGGFEDRILWHKAVAKKYPSYDISRVGIYGNSAGGQNAAGAVLFHPEFYKVSVASCGCHDNRMDKASWNEQWMGYPVGPQYSECSNIDNAHRLRGKLFLIVGEMDNNVPPESTMRLVDALVKAEKDFDLLVIPGGGHGMGGSYGQRRMQDFFVRNLLGVEPPDRNGVDSQEN